MGKDPDAQGSGSEKREFIWEQAEIVVNCQNQRSDKQIIKKGLGRGNVTRTQAQVKTR